MHLKGIMIVLTARKEKQYKIENSFLQKEN
jgi:hypothetical protein